MTLFTVDKKWIILLGLVIALGLFLLFARQPSSRIDLTGQGIAEVVLTAQGFVPNEFAVSVGTEVVFTTEAGKPFWPASNIHPSHDIYPAFDPERPLAPDESWSFTFAEVGTWGFHDHVRSYYTGIIEVVE